jgi:hypothetical protein
MAKKNALTSQSFIQSAVATAINSASAVGLNVAIGSILGVTGALKNAPEALLRLMPGLGSALNYSVATRFLVPKTHPQLHFYTAEQLAKLLDINKFDAEELLAQKKTYQQVTTHTGASLTHHYIFRCLNRDENSLSMHEIKRMFPEHQWRFFHTSKIANAGYEILRLGTAAAVSYALPAQITESPEADGTIKGAVAIAAGDIAVSLTHGAFAFWSNRSASVPTGYAAVP